MSTMYGADVAELRALAAQFERTADQLDHGRMAVGNAIRISAWVGPFATTFRLQWESEHSRRIMSAVGALRANARQIRANADGQERTSAAESSTTPSPDPGLTKDLGDYERVDHVSLDDSEFNADHIYQGALGDCWFLASLGSIVERNPEFIRNQMHLNDDGTWTVTMYRDGKPVYITVEPTVAENGAGGAGGQPNWASIYEKAAAVYFGGDYGDIDGDYPDRALSAITGAKADRLGELSLSEIREKLNDGPVVLSSEQQDKGDTPWWPFDHEVDNDKIVPGHAYMVDDVREVDGQLKIHVVNPWGPDGGSYHGKDRVGDMWLTEQEYRENFDGVYAAKWNG